MRQDELDRRRELLTATEVAIDAWLQWQERDGAALIVPEELRVAWTDMVAVWADGSIPGDCRELARTVEEFDREHLTPWLGQMERSGQQAVLPANAFWAALEAVAKHLSAATMPARKPLEPVKDLVKQGVSHIQIAKIYGFQDARGNWSEAMVREELAKPGRHTGEGWVDPRERRKQGRAAARQEAVERARLAVERKLARRDAKPRESLAELIEQGVSLEQIARMFHVGPEDILAQCQAEGLPTPTAAPPNASMAGIFDQDGRLDRGGAAEEREEAAQLAADDEAQTIEEQIVACHVEGLSVKETVQALAHVEGIGERKVRAVIKRYEENPAAFGAAVVRREG